MRTRPNITCAAIAALCVGMLLAAVGSGRALAQSSDTEITPTSIGPALIGSTVEELTDQLGDAYVVGEEVRITVDFNGHVVSRDGQVQFRAVKSQADSDQLILFIVNNNDYATAEGVGPGTTIADAEQAYGEATLSWNPDDEGREFVSFANQPEGRIAFRTPGIAGTNVGIYDEGAFETTEYEPGGIIAAIWVSCIPGTDCPADLESDSGAVDAGDDGTDSGGTDSGSTDDGTDSDGTDSGSTDDGTDSGGDDSQAGSTDDGSDGTDSGSTDDGTDSGGDDSQAGSGDDGADGTDGAGSDGGGAELPATGFEEILLVTMASALFIAGGFLVLVHRNYLAPAWLHSRRW